MEKLEKQVFRVIDFDSVKIKCIYVDKKDKTTSYIRHSDFINLVLTFQLKNSLIWRYS